MNPEFSVSDFVAIYNQTVEYAFPSVSIVGELSNLRISKQKWVYFDLKDEYSSVKFFGTVFMLPGPLDDGMVVKVTGSPKLHNTYGFSVNARAIIPVGEGTIKKAAELLRQKLQLEGLFAKERKRALPYPPEKIGLVTSGESAGYVDFLKILSQRWGGLKITHVDVQVQGENAPMQLTTAIQQLNMKEDIECIVVARGGGSADDLQTFNNEVVVRAVATSRVPTMVAIGHETDTCLAELAADMRASTPSNAAELLVPDKKTVIMQIKADMATSVASILQHTSIIRNQSIVSIKEIRTNMLHLLDTNRNSVEQAKHLLHSYNPTTILQKGYVLVHNQSGKRVRSYAALVSDDIVTLQFIDGAAKAQIVSVNKD